jgi:predicted amidophosphoribosyltransferase
MAPANRNDLKRLDGNFESTMIRDAKGMVVGEHQHETRKTVTRPTVNPARRMEAYRSRSKADIQSQSAAMTAPIDGRVDLTVSGWRRTWKTQETLAHTYNAWTHTIKGDFEKAIREMNLAIDKTQGRVRALLVRRELLKIRAQWKVGLDKFDRDQQRQKCNCYSCRNIGADLYRSFLCQKLALQPCCEEQLAFSEWHQSAFAYRWRGDESRDVVSSLWGQYKDGRGSDELALLFAVLLKEFVTDYRPEFLRGVDVIVPVPPDPVRLKERGFDPVGKIFSIFSRLVCIPYVSGTLVKQHRPSCRSLNASERERASRGMFSTITGNPLSGLNILLVDDVITSGHTIKNCANLLQSKENDVRIRVLSIFQSESSKKAAQVKFTNSLEGNDD